MLAGFRLATIRENCQAHREERDNRPLGLASRGLLSRGGFGRSPSILEFGSPRESDVLNSASLIVVYACMVHYVFATALLMDSSAVGITAISSVVGLVGSDLLAAGCFLCVGSLAILGLGASGRIGLILMAPQQFILIVSAGGAINAMITGRFADGVVRPHWFLIADQSPAVAAAIAHTIALVRIGILPWTQGR